MTMCNGNAADGVPGKWISRILTIALSVFLSGLFAWMNYALHENRLWFSNIEEVEREISFRTECGLYYSYYKNLINITNHDRNLLTSLYDGLRQLSDDRRTEAPHSINVIQRFNIFQEVLLAVLYPSVEPTYSAIKQFGALFLSPYLASFIPAFPTPIFFYVYACFFITGFGIFCTYWLTSALCTVQNSHAEWPMGLLAVAWIFSNLEDATRVNFTLNLRENFALPIFWLQNYYVICALQRGIEETAGLKTSKSASNLMNYIFISISTLFLSAFWQFNQFLLILQSVGLFAVLVLFDNGRQYSKNAVGRTIARILYAQIASFILLIPLQGFQPMLLTSISIQINVAIILSIKLISSTFNSQNNFLTTFTTRTLIVLFMTSCFGLIRKYVFSVHADDSHIWIFASAKLKHIINFLINYKNISFESFAAPFSITELADLPFETAIYLCHGAFAFIDLRFFQRTFNTGLLPVYLITITTIIFYCIRQIFYNISTKHRSNSEKTQRSITESHSLLNPSLLYFATQSVFSGLMACLMLRLKFLFLPQMAIFGACYIGKFMDAYVGKKTRTMIFIAVVAAQFAKQYGNFRSEMANEQEFYDPDTVALMEWISRSTKADAIFAGSMQLMAGVKCCSSRPIANHPHFEDKWLRERTQRIYQIYAKKAPGEVHKILRNEKIDYIIVEESICFVRPNGCTTGELMDLANKQIPELIKDSQPLSEVEQILLQKGYTSNAKTTRFCASVRDFNEKSSSLFRLVFQNPTFRIYEILHA